MRARLISSEREEGGLVVVELNGQEIGAMDCLGYGHAGYPKPEEEFDLQLTCLHSETEDWSTLFAGNPEKQKALQRLGSWNYRAFGEIVALESHENEAALVDCGVCLLPVPIRISADECIGQYVAFDITRLDAWRTNAAA